MSDRQSPSWRRKNSERIQYKKDAAYKQADRQHHQDNVEIVRAINRVAREQKATHKQERAYEGKKGFREWLTIIAVSVAACVAAVAVIVSHGDTRRTLKDARGAASIQHADTLAALDEATNANAVASRQADAAEKSIPRSWLYVEFPKTFVPTVSYATGTPAGTRTFAIDRVPIEIKNYGQIPATITAVKATLYVPNVQPYSWDSPFDQAGARKPGFAERSAHGQDEFAGITLSPGEPFETPFGVDFVFTSQPLLAWGVDGVPKWLLVVVDYSDPAGAERETSYLGRIFATGITADIDQRYNYHR